MFPPAIALTQEELRDTPQFEDLESFDGHVNRRLRHHLDLQSRQPYLLVRKVGHETLYYGNDHYHWVLGWQPHHKYSGGPSLRAVAYDDLIYPTPLDYWDISQEALIERFGPPPQE